MNLKKIIREEFDDLLWINEIDVKLKDLIESGLINKIIEKNTTLTLSGTVDDLSRRGEEKFKSDVVFDVKLLGTDGTVEGTHFRLVYCDDEYYPLIIFGYPEECEGVFLKSDGDLVVDNYNDIIKELGVINESEDNDLDWIKDVPGELPEIDDENKFLVLVKILGINEVFGDVTGWDDPNTQFEQNRWTHYGIDTFNLENGQEWVVGTIEEADDALYQYWEDYTNNVELGDIDNLRDYLTMSERDRRFFAEDMSNNYVYELSDKEVIGNSSYDEEFEDLEERISELEDQRDGIDTSIDDQISELEKEKDNLIDRAREEVREEDYERWYECLEDPYRCLVREHGFYMGVRDLLDSGNVDFNKERWVSDMVDDSNYGELSPYDGNYYEEDGYIAFRTN